MNRRLTALFAALEALLVVGVGIGVPLVPLTLMWALQYGLTIDWVVFWRAAVDIWLLGHGVDVHFTLDPQLAASSGFAEAAAPFVITIAPLAFAVVTVLLGVRAGRRIGETPYRYLGALVGLAVFGALSLGVAFTALSASARPSLVQSALLPTLVFGLGVLVGSERSRRAGGMRGGPSTDAAGARVVDAARVGDAAGPLAEAAPAVRDEASGGLRSGVMRMGSGARASVDTTGRRVRRFLRDAADGPAAYAIRVAGAGGAGAAAIVLAISAVTVAILVGVSYAQIISLFEAVQSGVLGGAALTVGQLAFIPNLVIWAASWFVGPGFALGTGSAVSPLGTELGPLPAIPLLGALPAGELSFAYVGLLVPLLAGFIAASVLRPRLVRDGVTGPVQLVAAGLGIGLGAGVVLGALAWIASGSAGPGRLVDVGSDWLLVGCWAALEIGLAAAIALVVGGLSREKP